MSPALPWKTRRIGLGIDTKCCERESGAEYRGGGSGRP
jgi:hypothetical protein